MLSLRTFAPLLLAPLGCFTPLDVPLAEIPKLQSLEEVMHAIETVSGPQWKKGGSDSYADADWDRAKDASERLFALSERAKSFSRGEAFDKYAGQLGARAKSLGAAAAAKDVAGANKSIDELKATCKACHAETR